MTSSPDRTNPIPLVVVCIEDHPKTIMMLRMARKRALERGARWCAVFVETPAYLQKSGDSPHERMLRLLTLAEQMGGESVHLEAQTIEEGLLQLFTKEAANLSLVMVGSTESEHWLPRLRPLSWVRIVRLASQYAQVEVVPLSGHSYHRGFAERLHLRAVRPKHLAYALVAVGAAYLMADFLEWELPPALFRVNNQNIVLLFMIACAFVAGRFGLLPGLVTAVASFFTVNYYFTPPYHAFKLTAVTDIINMGLFLSAALLISLFTSQTREYAQKAAKRELSTQALFTLYRIASEAFSREQALEKLQQKLEHMLEVDVAFFLPTVLNPERVEPVFAQGRVLSEMDRRALDVCWTEMKTTGLASPFNPGTAWRFEPMVSHSGELGVLGARLRGKTRMDAWFGRLLTAIADQTATVVAHIELERSMEDHRVSDEREKLRSMLLSSVSHDFKTPLAGIIGALSVHRSLGDRLSPAKREELIEAAIEEAQRLDSFITNILDMTRLESGNIQFRKEWRSVDGMIDNVVRRLRHRMRQHELVVHPPEFEVEAMMDGIMTEQVLQNVLDNACKYTLPGTRIELSCKAEEGKGLLCEVRDHGPGLPPDKLNVVFDKYARLHKKDTQVAGTGLGLAISRAVMEAQGGSISAANHPDGGAVFSLYLPQWRRAGLPKLQAGTAGGAAV